jgi:hypothetical protein
MRLSGDLPNEMGGKLPAILVVKPSGGGVRKKRNSGTAVCRLIAG